MSIAAMRFVVTLNGNNERSAYFDFEKTNSIIRKKASI